MFASVCCLLVSSLPRKRSFRVTQFSPHCVTTARIPRTLLTISKNTTQNTKNVLQNKYFFFERKPKHQYYKPNNSAAAIIYKKNWIGKKTTTNKQKTQRTKNVREETKQNVFFLKFLKFENVTGQMCSPWWSCLVLQFHIE